MFASGKSASVSTVANYIEDVFSTYLYTGTGADQTITTGIDLSTKGGLLWVKKRSFTDTHFLVSPSTGGAGRGLDSGSTNALSSFNANSISSLSTTGFGTGINFSNNAATYVSWTFRKQPKFFDIVTYTGDGGVNGDSNPSRAIAHSLGSQPGMVIIKRTDSTSNWYGVHRNDGTNNAYWCSINLTNAATAGLTQSAYNTYITSTTFGPFAVRDSLNQTPLPNVTGATYVAYLFAHNAGGFGLTGTDNVISCGSYTTDGATTTTVNLGYEPQWLMVKLANGTDSWYMFDNMRGLTVGGNDAYLQANASAAESSSEYIVPTATGFNLPTSSNFNNAGQTYIYIAIRRGPMKVPTDGTKVFALDSSGGTLPNPPGFNAGFPVDLGFFKYTAGVSDWSLGDRLRGAQELYPNLTSAEVARADFKFDYQDGWLNSTGVASTIQSWNFRRAPSFFDEVCYTGTGTGDITHYHNLTVAPELIIWKRRNSSASWPVWCKYTGSSSNLNQAVFLDTTAAATNEGFQLIDVTLPTSSIFYTWDNSYNNASGSTYVAYLFATCAGVSKVGSYTGTGTTKQIDCGFSGGARFVLIKRTDSTGDWYVWDTARGIVSGNDPYLLLNSTAAEVTGTDYIDTYSAGFEISSTAPSAINANGGSFIFLAIA
jgi:hypothetical protein